MPKISRPIAAAVLSSMLLMSCSTTGRDSEGHPRTALDRSIGQCVVAIGVGAIAGALLGAAVNRRNGAGTGAAIGAGFGAVQCAIIFAVNNAQDRERIRQAEQAAYNSGRSSTAQFVGQDGAARVVRTSVAAAPLPAQLVVPGKSGDTIVGPCRRAQTQITVAGKGTVSLDPELVCRTAQGDYIAIDNKTT